MENKGTSHAINIFWDSWHLFPQTDHPAVSTEQSEKILHLVWTIIDIIDWAETTIKLVKMDDDLGGCTIGFLSRMQSILPKVVDYLDKFAAV
jgi:hypothetical protein